MLASLRKSVRSGLALVILALALLALVVTGFGTDGMGGIGGLGGGEEQRQGVEALAQWFAARAM